MPPYDVTVTFNRNKFGRWEFRVQSSGVLYCGSASTFDEATECVKKTIANLPPVMVS